MTRCQQTGVAGIENVGVKTPGMGFAELEFPRAELRRMKLGRMAIGLTMRPKLQKSASSEEMSQMATLKLF